jgi:hypothetical protein
MKKNYKIQNTMPLSIKKAGAKTNTNYKLQITNIGKQNSTEKKSTNEKFLRGPGAVFSKRVPGRRRQN